MHFLLVNEFYFSNKEDFPSGKEKFGKRKKEKRIDLTESPDFSFYFFTGKGREKIAKHQKIVNEIDRLRISVKKNGCDLWFNTSLYEKETITSKPSGFLNTSKGELIPIQIKHSACGNSSYLSPNLHLEEILRDMYVSNTNILFFLSIDSQRERIQVYLCHEKILKSNTQGI